MSLNPELRFQIRSLSRFVFFQTDEEDLALLKIRDMIEAQKEKARQRGKDEVTRAFVFNPTMGLHPMDAVIKDWTDHKEPINREAFDINEVFERIYKTDTKGETHIYVITDPDRYLNDLHIQRRIINLAHHLKHHVKSLKLVIFVGSRRVVPEKLSRYMEVVVDSGLSKEDIQDVVTNVCSNLDLTVPDDCDKLFRGLTTWEITASISQSVIKTRPHRRIDPECIMEYRRRVLRKSDLLSYVDTKDYTFDQVGGVQRFKQWVDSTRACWTEEGQQFGLTPPKGVLAVGVWGCGKSLSVKAMGQAWKLPVVSLEMGRLRGSLTGASESNVYQAINIIERVAPCIVWIDEAEKSLSGGQSSALTDSGTTSRMIGILSTWLQETDAPVCLALTANSLGTMPIEFVNRMDERFFFDLPTQKDRIEILKIHLAKRKQDPRAFDLSMLAEKADLMVGREIEQAIKAALRESFNKRKGTLDEAILAEELSKKPRIFKTMADDVQNLLEWVGYDQDADDGIRARFASPPSRRKAGGGGGAFQVIEDA